MKDTIHLLAISGSLQRQSVNAAVLKAAVETAAADVRVVTYTGLGDLPHFNPDLDGPQAPPSVLEFRAMLAAADGVVIATPEYAHAMPGVLKNALDWVVGSGELVGKPTAVLSASSAVTAGIHAQQALVQLLHVMSAPVVETVGVGTVRSKLDADGEVSDPETRRRLGEAIAGLVRTIRGAALTC